MLLDRNNLSKLVLNLKKDKVVWNGFMKAAKCCMIKRTKCLMQIVNLFLIYIYFCRRN